MISNPFPSRFAYMFWGLSGVAYAAGTGLTGFEPPAKVSSVEEKREVGSMTSSPQDKTQIPQQGANLPIPRYQEQLVYLDGGGENRVFLPLGSKWIALIRNHQVKAWLEEPTTKGQVLDTCAAQGYVWRSVIEGLEDNVPHPKVNLFRYSIETQVFGWEKVGEVDTKHGVPSMLVPLGGEGNRFLGISNGLGFFGEDVKDASFVALFKQREGRIEFSSCVELTFDGTQSACRKVEIQREANKEANSSNSGEKRIFTFCEATPRSLWPTLWHPSISVNYLALGAPEAGVIWILDLNKGSVKHTLNLFSLSKADLDRVKPLKQVILGTAFAPDGELILATREPELVDITVRLASSAEQAKSLEESRSSLDSEGMGNDRKEEEDKNFQIFAEQSKKIQWWSIDPETGAKNRLDSPTVYPDRVPSYARQGRLRFLVDSNGYIKTNAFTSWSLVLEGAGIVPPSSGSAKTLADSESGSSKVDPSSKKGVKPPPKETPKTQ
jgi:hypothetical protein